MFENYDHIHVHSSGTGADNHLESINLLSIQSFAARFPYQMSL